jgi:hypothetical protein
MTTVHHSPPPGATPFSIYEDPEDQEPPSPSEIYEGDTSFISDMSLPAANEPIASIETDMEDAPQPYESSFTSRPTSRARRISAATNMSIISALPSELSIASKPAPSFPIGEKTTPRKERAAFRNPSSVRALQMSSPPPFAAYESPQNRLKGTYKMATPSRSGRSETPVSMSGSQREGRRGSVGLVPPSPRPVPAPQQHLPLVLLHVTILPMQLPYTHDFMIRAMPQWLVDNYKLLEEKLQDIILMRRGLLVPHPREEYDLLEERILESLELKTPRLLKCGHFVPVESDDEDSSDSEAESEAESHSPIDDGAGRRSRMSETTTLIEEGSVFNEDDKSVCMDCHRHIKKPGKGVGAGTKRWDIKLYAANGLMRAGAWSAAWREMERCDVEISPWIPEDVRKALEKRIEDEQEAEKHRLLYQADLQRRIEEEKMLRLEAEEKLKAEAAELQKRLEAEAAAEAARQMKLETEEAERQRQAETIEGDRQRKLEEEEVEKRRLDDVLRNKMEEAKESIRMELEAQSLAEASSVAERFRALEQKLAAAEQHAVPQPAPYTETSIPDKLTRPESRGRPQSSPRRPDVKIPLSTLMLNYFLVLIREPRNFAIILLSVFVVFLAMHASPGQQWPLSSLSLPEILPDETMPELVSQVVITTTATFTATEVATMTVTHTEQQVETMVETASPLETESALDVPSSVEEEIFPTPILAESSALPISSSSVEDASESSQSSSPAESTPTSPPDEESLLASETALPSSSRSLDTSTSSETSSALLGIFESAAHAMDPNPEDSALPTPLADQDAQDALADPMTPEHGEL